MNHTQVSAAENNVQDEFFSAVESKSIENKSPAFATEAASKLVKKIADINKALKLLNWSDIDGFQVVHLPSEELSKIKDLAVYNDLAVQAAVQIGGEAVRKKVDLSEAPILRFLELFSSACLVGIDGRQVKKDIYFTLSSGGFIPDKEECRLFAWVLAANGIRITRSEEKTRLLVLDYVGATQHAKQNIGEAE
jgi:hypothetical protein